MSTYKEINGKKVEYLASDPSAPYAGQVWYNYSSQSLKFNAGTLVQSWSTQNTMTYGRKDPGSAGSVYNAGIAIGGQISGANENRVESYNGSWTNVTGLPNDRTRIATTGTQTLALGCGGYTTTSISTVDSYNGSWTGQTNMPDARFSASCVGTSTSAVVFGGSGPSPALGNDTRSYNGSWTAQPDMVNSQYSMGSSGTSSTLALAFGGYDGVASGFSNRTQIYNGSWTSLAGVLNQARAYMGSSGSTTAAIASSGNPRGVESWNGTSWTVMPTLSTGREGLAGIGAGNANTTVFGGEPNLNNTEQFTDNQAGIRTITTS